MNKSDRTLVAGPWVGEFGWELFAWQGYVRSLSQHFEKTIIICRPTSADLYRDFADEFVFCDAHTGLIDSYYMHGFDFASELKKIIVENNLQQNSALSVFTPRRIGTPPHTHYTEPFTFGNINVKPNYITFKSAQEITSKYNYVFHLRQRSLRNNNNWNIENWNKLKELLDDGEKTFACVGTKKDAGYVEETEDLRGIPLQQLFGVLHNSTCVFGPSSGPMHLSSLCAARHLVWGDRSFSLYRYEDTWNPHQTPVLFLDKHGWQPPPEHVYNKYMEWTND
jgi:hypothetical protein